MDPLTARVTCLELADSLINDDDADASDILAVAQLYWDWIMRPFTLVDVPSEDDENATRQ